MSRSAYPAGGHWYVGKSRESLNCEQAPLERYRCQNYKGCGIGQGKPLK